MTFTQPLPLRRSLVFLLSLTLGVVCFGLVGTSVAQEPNATQPGTSDGAASDSTQGADSATEPETASPTTAGVGQLKVELEPQEITVGDLVTATLSLVWMGAEPDEAPRFPTWQETWGRAEILQRGEVTSRVDDSGRRLYSQQLTLTSFEVGEVSVPAPTVVIPLGDRSVDVTAEDAASFQVVSVLPPEAQKEADDDAEANQPAGDNAEATGAEDTGAEDTENASSLEPKPAADPRALRDATSFAITTAALSLLNLLAGGLLVRRLRHAAGLISEAPEPWVPPLEGLLSQLDGVDPNGDSEPVHTAISLALRRYLSRHLAWNAAGSTTSEIQRQLRSTRVTPAMTQSLVQLFKDCDQVKFARQQVSPSVNSDRLARAREMGRSLEVFLAPQVTPPPETAQDRVPSGSTASKPSTSSKPPAPPTPNPQVSA